MPNALAHGVARRAGKRKCASLGTGRAVRMLRSDTLSKAAWLCVGTWANLPTCRCPSSSFSSFDATIARWLSDRCRPGRYGWES